MNIQCMSMTTKINKKLLRITHTVWHFSRGSPFVAPISQSGDPPLPRGPRFCSRLIEESRFSQAPCPGVSLWFQVECSDCKQNANHSKPQPRGFLDSDLLIKTGDGVWSKNNVVSSRITGVKNNCIKCKLHNAWIPPPRPLKQVTTVDDRQL